jgi:hypothetical protein
MSAATLDVVFEVSPDEAGGYCAHAKLGAHSLVTEGDTLDELVAMIRDVLSLYTQQSGNEVASYALRFIPANPIAA